MLPIQPHVRRSSRKTLPSPCLVAECFDVVLQVATVTHTTPSTGFLVGTPSESPSSFIAYFGDVGPDGGVTMRGVVAQVNTLFEHRCQQLSKPGALRALLLECSYIDGRLDAALYGHLTPMLVAQLIRGISKSCEGQLDVSDTHLIITHTKPTWGNIDNSSYTPTAAKKAIEFRSRAMLPSQVIRSQLEQHLKATMGQEWVSSRLHVSGDGRVQQGSILAL